MNPTPAQIRCNDYVEVLETLDEWEGLVGIVEELFDINKQPCADSQEACFATVRFPLRHDGQKAVRLYGVNHFTDYVRKQLKAQEELEIFSLTVLEWLDPDEL